VPGSRIPGAGAPRVATIVHLSDASTGQELVVVDVHLDEASSDRRARSIRQLIDVLPGAEPVVVLGDLNATPSERDVYGPLEDAGFVDALPPDAPGTAHRFRGGTDGPRIDAVMVNRRLEVLDAEVVTQPPGARPASDHWPVRATLRVRDLDR
jgi:endonuclease/exonuclease/phosphatase family metal-dependent hydrolase